MVRVANACTHPDLFWGIKGGGGGSLGVVTKLTLRTRELPNFIGAVFNRITSKSDAAFQRLIAEFIRFYSTSMFNPHWGNLVHFSPDNSITIEMLFQGLDKQQAQDVWRPFFDWVESSPDDFSLESRPLVLRLFGALVSGFSGRGFTTPYGAVIFDMPAQYWWNAEVWRKYLPGLMVTDDRAGSTENKVFYAANFQEAAWFIHGYQSVWMPAVLLKEERQKQLVDALFASSRYCEVALHFNKGLAGGSADAIAATKDTAMNPAVLDSFALAIVAEFGPPAFPGIPGHEPDLALARKDAGEIDKSMNELRKIVPDAGSYLAEGNFFERSWQQSFWGPNYPRLQAVKRRYDPAGLFFVHHGVGSEEWSADGFTRLSEG